MSGRRVVIYPKNTKFKPEESRILKYKQMTETELAEHFGFNVDFGATGKLLLEQTVWPNEDETDVIIVDHFAIFIGEALRPELDSEGNRVLNREGKSVYTDEVDPKKLRELSEELGTEMVQLFVHW